MTAIGTLIKQVIGSDKAKKRTLALAISPAGTKNADKAFSRLADLMRTGQRLDAYQEKLRDALEVEDALFNDAIQDTKEQLQLESQLQRLNQQLEYRKRFTPHIFMIGEQKRPSSITLCGLTGGNRHRMITFDPEEFAALSIQDQLDRVRSLIKIHQEEKKGVVPFFGNAVAYLYRTTPDGDGVQFDPQGNIEPSTPDNKTHFGEAMVRIG